MRSIPDDQPHGLRAAPGLLFPLDMVTQTIAIIAMKRAGKSNLAALLAELMFRAGLPWVAIDPKGDWWGLRADGTGPGLPIPVIGGAHGDVPVTVGSGPLLARLVFEQNLTCIIDVSRLRPRADQIRFLTEFGQQLFDLHQELPQPRHVFLEEAHELMPQVVRGDDMGACVETWVRLIKQGGTFGLGATVIDQRSQAVNKEGLTQCGTLIALRTMHGLDLKAAQHFLAFTSQGRAILDTLPTLPDGEAYVISPEWLARYGQPAIQRVRFNRRTTYDSAATPTLDQARPPATLASVDLAALLARMGAVAEEAAHDDPVALRQHIRALERQVRELRAPGQEASAARLSAEIAELREKLAEALARPPVQVPVFRDGEIEAAGEVIAAIRGEVDRLGDLAAGLGKAIAKVTGQPPHAAGTGEPSALPALRRRRRRRRPVAIAAMPMPELPGDVKLMEGERVMLAALARSHPLHLTASQLGAFSGFAASGGTFGTYLGTLVRHGYVARTGNQDISLTPAGLALFGGAAAVPQTAAELRETWRQALLGGERKMFDALVLAYPEPVSYAQLAEATGYAASGGTFGTYLGTLRRNGLAEQAAKDRVRAAEMLFREPADA